MTLKAVLKTKKQEPTVSEVLKTYKKAVNDTPSPIPLKAVAQTITTIKNLALISKKLDVADAREAIAIASLSSPDESLEFRVLYDKSTQTGLYIDRNGLFILTAKQNGAIKPHIKHRSFLFEEFAVSMPFWGTDDFTEKVINAAIANVNTSIISQLKDHHDKITRGEKRNVR